MEFRTEQEEFWAGEFGDRYAERNSNPHSIASQTAIFARILCRTYQVQQVLELGANIGHNLLALQRLLPECSFTAVEINHKAAVSLEAILHTRVFRGSIFDFSAEQLGSHDLTMTAGVLIHINPELISDVYDRLYRCSRKYILLWEYYNPSPVEVSYRGHSERLFKRDFAGEMMDRFSDLELVDYGFQYHRDPNFPADDSTWFLLRKRPINVNQAR